MAFQDVHLAAAIATNPPKLPTQYTRGTTLDAYLAQLVDALAAGYPDRAREIRARSQDLRRRLSVMVKRRYEHFREASDALHYRAPGQVAWAALPPALRERYSINQQPDVRAQVAGVMGIADKGHEQHGANFDAPQTLKQIIDNLFARVSDAQSAAVAARLVQRYGYDPR